MGVGASFSQQNVRINQVRLLIDLRNLKRKIKYKPYPMPKISELFLNLKDFKYDTSLDLNMEYYYI